MIALADMPDIDPVVVSKLIAELASDAIAAPVYSDEPDRLGHPVLFGADYRSALESLSGDAGARSIIEANRSKVIRIEVCGRFRDIDTPDDVLQLEQSS